ncbi:type I-C CRISPR-associated protein Cas8c/Csd1 [Porphyromonas endodontalis]|uniref:type I-C CRISPR-associated protein Cas8c/Csd1 n=1 Tax=Porphyromonas endodontalis TaxID=28124 RepID=UPI0028E83BD8|nr:type I-C CRISPR-associated protein Cas8c/Csd1 [Porphyromonas endodontalis]
MILQALYQYYQQMHAVGADIAPPGMEKKAIPFIIELTPDGEVIQVSETMDSENKKGKTFLVSRSATRSGKNAFQVAQVMWDHLGYVLGVSKDGTEKEEQVAPMQNESFIKKADELRELYPENPHITAVARFYQNGHALRLIEDETIIKDIQKTTGANISFRVRDLEDDRLVASIEDVQSYMNRAAESKDTENSNTSVCLVTGEKSTIARLHPSVKLAGAQATASLINFQKSSGFDSYGKEQGFNAPVSVHAAESIATALNNLLAKDKNTNYRVGDTAFVFWSNLADEELLSSYRAATFSGLSNPSEEEENPDSENSEEEKTKKSRRKSKKTLPLPIAPNAESHKVLETLKAACGYKGGKVHEDNGRFYILGLAPNAARISIKLWAEGSIPEIVGNTLQHQYDMNIISEKGNVDAETPPLRSIYQIVKTVSSSDKSDKWSSNLIQSIVESIVENKPYPQSLQQACLERIRRGNRITELRAAILKAYINRKKQQEYITMSLDPNQTNKAYLAGRLFALFESIQQCALGGNLNRTIRDAYYGTASTTPRTIFGRLDALSKVHLSKLRKEKPGLAILKEKQLEEIYNLIPGGAPEMPTHFSLDDQSIFAVGYYHQRVEAWRKKEETEDHLEE